MNLQSQYNTIDQGKELLQYGIDPELSNAKHLRYSNGGCQLILYSQPLHGARMSMIAVEYGNWTGSVEQFPAFSLAELGVMLGCNQEGVMVGDHPEPFIKFSNETAPLATKKEAEYRCSLVLYLLANNIVSSVEMNERLKNA